ncbi:MAG: KaiC domain-containing protein [Candidatus Thermoplasmatota archaeon]|jgi:KaiC domain protein|nr:KaiC domain-containing protein [Candidatus Thermoplasmatota archaeon]MCL5963938.1 KaiC domain-containing protein [Candidatus Thermoplasmatota archaeon]
MKKIVSGIDGLDDMLDKGIVQGHTLAVLGECGTGKTTLGLQFLVAGLKAGEKAILVSLEEEFRSIVENSSNFNWDLEKYANEKKLLAIKLNPEDSKGTFLKLSTELEESIKTFGASRILFDSISLFAMLFDSEDERRTNLFKLASIFKRTGATTIFTSEVNPLKPTTSRDGLIEYVVDGVVLLQFYELNNSRQYTTTLKIVKMRGSKHSKEIRPYEISTGIGMRVLKSALI